MVLRLTNPAVQVLEKHVSFFDPDGDCVITPSDTYRACRSFSWTIPTSVFFTAFLHSVQSYNTQPGLLPDPVFRLYVRQAYMNKHGSGTGTFDSEGRFRPQPLEDFFAKFDSDGKGGLTKWELWHGLRRSRMAFDFFGRFRLCLSGDLLGCRGWKRLGGCVMGDSIRKRWRGRKGRACAVTCLTPLCKSSGKARQRRNSKCI